MKPRIGISSIYRIANYGSTLQAVALEHTIRKLGYDCSHIRYLRHIGGHHLGLVKRIAHSILDSIRQIYIPSLRRQRRFSQFWKRNLFETKLYTEPLDAHSLNAMFDAFACGSDQIWAPNQYNPFYFLSFVDGDFRKVAYAPSVGLAKIPSNLKDIYRQHIEAIPALSVRGVEDASLLKQQLDISAQSVLDPTLLLTTGEWLSYSTKNLVRKTPYIFCYLLGDTVSHRQAITNFSKLTGLKVIAVADKADKQNWPETLLRKDLGPKEWLRALADAEYVITDSYHGMLFSILFEKNFFEILRFKADDPLCQNSRVASIAKQLSLNDRVLPFENPDIPVLEGKIDYRKVDELIGKDRAFSIGFLKQSLENATRRNHE